MRSKAAIAITTREALDLSTERLTVCEQERRRFLQALFVIRRLLVGHEVKAMHIRTALAEIDLALGIEDKP